MSISVKFIFQFYTELELLKVAAGTIDPTPTLLGLIIRASTADRVPRTVYGPRPAIGPPMGLLELRLNGAHFL